MKRALIITAVIVFIFFLAGAYFFYRAWYWFHATGGFRMPAEFKAAKVIAGGELFLKRPYFSGSGLGTVTDIENGSGGGMVIVGRDSATLLTANLSVAKTVLYQSCGSDVVLSRLRDNTFLCRGSWGAGVTLSASDGKQLWAYDNIMGIDDSAPGELSGRKVVVVGLNGSGGIRLLDSDGKELWRQNDGNVWHVEIVEGEGENVIVHSNAAGQLTVRDGAGKVLARFQPEIYLAHFSRTAWKDEPRQNELITAGKDFLYIISSRDGKTLAKLSAPQSIAIAAEAKGTPVTFSASAPFYAALVRYPVWDRSILLIYSAQDQLLYDEILDEDCGALHPVAAKGGQDLLVGCNDRVWEYLMNKINRKSN